MAQCLSLATDVVIPPKCFVVGGRLVERKLLGSMTVVPPEMSDARGGR